MRVVTSAITARADGKYGRCRSGHAAPRPIAGSRADAAVSGTAVPGRAMKMTTAPSGASAQPASMRDLQ
jgi:hypothetical protein